MSFVKYNNCENTLIHCKVGMSAQARKTRIRGGHRSVVTKRLGEVEAVLGGGDRPDPIKLGQLKLILLEKLEVLRQLDKDIVDEIEDETALVKEIDEADMFNQRIYEVLMKIDKAIEAPPTTTPVPGSYTGTGPSLGHSPGKARLPKLTLKSFDGDITQWLTFWDSYKSAIHDNLSLSDIDKFTYLRSLVERSAKEAIVGLTLTSDNYNEAVAILERRFGNRQRIIDKHMDLLLNVEAVSSQHNVGSLRRLYDRVEANVRSLDALGVTADSYGSLLSSVLIKKLPHELRLIISRKVSGDWDMASIMKLFEEELIARERTVTTGKETGGRQHKDQPTTTALVSGGHTMSYCCYCQKGHAPESCPEISLVEDRRQALRSAGRCFICLKRGHIGRECRSNQKCRKCGGKHHVSICYRGQAQAPPKGGDKSGSNPTRSGSNSTRSEADSGRSGFEYATGPSSTTSMYVDSGKTVLLQTARATVFNPLDPVRSMEVNLLLDSGSQNSYIAERVSETLALTPKGAKTLSIMTFGADEGVNQTCSIVKLGLQTRVGPTKELTLLTVPFICKPLVSPPIQFCVDNYEYLNGLDLADTPRDSSHVQPDILVGLDHYWKLVTGETLQRGDGPVALNTNLGWVLSGPIGGSRT